MAEKRACSLCGEALEDAPAVHDVVICEKTELLKGRVAIKKLKAAIDFWKDGYYELRGVIGRLSWQHNKYVCPHETKTVSPIKPNPWLHEKDTPIVQMGKLVYLKQGIEWKLVGEGKDEEAAKAILRLMKDNHACV